MKIIDIIKTASSNMLRSKLRSLLTVIAIFIGAFTLTITNGIGAGISKYIDDQLGNIGMEDTVIIRAKTDVSLGGEPKKFDPNKSSARTDSASIPMLEEKDIEVIKKQGGLSDVKAYIGAAPNFVTGPNKERYVLSVSTFIDGLNLDLATGRLPNNSSSENELVLPLQFVDALGFKSNENAIGKHVTFSITQPNGEEQLVKANVVGVQEQSIISSTDGAYVNERLIDTLHSIQTQGFPSEVKNQSLAATAKLDQNISDKKYQAIKNNLDKKGYVAATAEDQLGVFKQVIDAIIAVLTAFAGIALLAASFGIVNTLLMSVQERTREIGLMKAMGMSSKKIFLLFSTEAVLLGFWGSVLGIAAAVGVGKIVNQIASDTFLKDLTGFDLTAFPATSLLAVLATIMIIAFLASTLPARRAAKQNPIDALRYE